MSFLINIITNITIDVKNAFNDVYYCTNSHTLADILTCAFINNYFVFKLAIRIN